MIRRIPVTVAQVFSKPASIVTRSLISRSGVVGWTVAGQGIVSSSAPSKQWTRAYSTEKVEPVTSEPVTSESVTSEPVTSEPISEALNQEMEKEAEEEMAEEKEPEKEPEIIAQETETVSGQSEQHEFKAETKRLLNIVANSLYSEKEVFLRELISNAADALEKLRHLQVSGTATAQPDEKMEIHISVDKDKNCLIIEDFGVGMTHEELTEHLGTIAKSGSLEFLQKESNGSAAKNIIGQFGCGFYSTFMVGDEIRVYTRSAALPNAKGYCWTSDGLGKYAIAEAEGVHVGTKIVIQLKAECKQFSNKQIIEQVVKKYSNFVGFPVLLNGSRINTIEPLWTMDKSQITEEQHEAFYRFISGDYGNASFRLQYNTDAPLSIRSLLYVPEQHSESLGAARMEPGVSLYSRRVLIKAKCKELLPEWLRFVKGVVDSEDVPVNLSRELLQDSALIGRLRRILTTRVVKWLDDESGVDEEKYNQFYRRFSYFLKEGLATDQDHRESILKLMRFESTKLDKKQMTSLAEYVKRMPEQQTEIYFMCSPSRHFALESPYLEPFTKAGYEVLLLHESVDPLVMQGVREFSGKKVVDIEHAKSPALKATEETAQGLSVEQAKQVAEWMKSVLDKKVSSVSVTERPVSHPAIIVGHQSQHMMKMMRQFYRGTGMEDEDGLSGGFPSFYQLEINPKHSIIEKLFSLRSVNEPLAREVAEQVMDNALIAAGALEDPRSMLARLNRLLETAVANAPTAATEKLESVEKVESVPEETETAVKTEEINETKSV